MVIATNGYTTESVFHHHRDRLMPALSNIIVTRPLTEDERAEQGWTSRVMAYDTRNLLHYFRLLPDGRFLFGGRGGTDASDGGAAPDEGAHDRHVEAHVSGLRARRNRLFLARIRVSFARSGALCRRARRAIAAFGRRLPITAMASPWRAIAAARWRISSPENPTARIYLQL